MQPILFHLGHLSLPTFGLLAAVGIMAALSLSLRTAVRVGLPPDALWNAGLFAVVAAFVLSRLLLVATDLRSFLHHPLLLFTLPSLTPVGLLLTAVATWLYLRRHGLALLPVLDAWAPCATLLWAALALGHFAEGSDPGLPTSLPWGVHMQPLPFAQHPVALYTTAFALALTVLLLRHHQRPHRAAPGTDAGRALILTGLGQYLLSFVREPLLAVYTPTPLVEPLQWLALAMVLIGSLLLLARPASHPGSSSVFPAEGSAARAL